MQEQKSEQQQPTVLTGKEAAEHIAAAKMIRLAEKALKRRQAAEKQASGKPFTAAQWKKKKNKSKIARKSRRNHR